jgi:Phage integrase family
MEGVAIRAHAAVRVHRCRHVYATRLLRSGVNIRVVQQLMRHASLQTTAAYTAVDEDELRDAVNDDVLQLDPHFGGMNTHGSHLAGGRRTDWLVVNTPGYDTIDLRSGLWRHAKRLVSTANIENVRDLAWPTLHGVSSTVIGDRGRNVLIAPKDDPTRGVRSILRGLAANDRLLAGRHDTAYGGPGHDFCRAHHRIRCEAH